MRKAIKDFIEELDKQEFCDVIQASLDMNKLPKVKNQNKITPTDELAETFAINFFPQVDKDDEAGTYKYGPKWVLPVGENDEMREFPSRSLVNNDLVAHWEKRMEVTSNVSLRARYADLVFDFLDVKTEGKRKSLAGRVFAEAELLLIKQGKTKYDNFRQMAKRGLYVAKLLNDEALLKKYINELIGLVKNGEYEAFVFRALVLDKRMQKLITDAQLKTLIKAQEAYVDAVLKGNKPRPFQINETAQDLLRYYTQIDDEVSAKKIASDVESDYRNSEYSNSSGILKSNYLNELRAMFQELAQSFEFAKEEVKRITAEIATINDDIEAEMQEFSYSHQLSNEEIKEIEAFIEHLFTDEKTKKPRNIHDTMPRAIINFIPKLDDERASFKKITKEHPISYLFTTTIVGEDGFNLATLNGLDEDEERYFARHYAQNLQFGDFLLRRALAKFVEVFTEEDMVNEILKSLVFRDEDKLYIERAVKAYWSNDYLPASQAFIPLIEDGLRNLHRLYGLPVIKPNEHGGYDYYALDRLVKHPMVPQSFSPIRGDDFQYYLEIVLLSAGGMGWNVRNNFAHGINKTSLLSPVIANRLLHIIFCLSLVRRDPKTAKEDEEK